MSSFKITMKDNSHEGVYQLEAAIRNVGEWKDFWGQPDGEMSQAWANSRMLMFATQGASTGPKWPGYTKLETKYWAKKEKLKVKDQEAKELSKEIAVHKAKADELEAQN